MVHRDPETGKFVSSGDSGHFDSYRDLRSASGLVSAEIPAADLSGGTTAHDSLEDANLLLDGDRYLEPNELMELVAVAFTSTLSGPTTASAESSMAAAVQYGFEETFEGVIDTPPAFWAGSGLIENSGVYDVNRGDEDADSALWMERLQATADFGDSTNGLGAGADIDRARRFIPYRRLYGLGPTLSADESLFAPIRIFTDNVSDHAVQVEAAVHAVYKVHEDVR